MTTAFASPLTLGVLLLTASLSYAGTVADSVRREAGRLAAQGRLDEAQELVERRAPDLPEVWRAMFAGKLALDGEISARGYTGAAADTAPEQMRGEAEFRLGQYHYAAGRHHLAIPQFREYLALHPEGTWSQESSYWMALSCMQFVKRRPDKAAYLDTAERYLEALEKRGRSAYYWPLARAAHARLHLLRGDTAGAARALRDARALAPPEEMPGVFLLSLQAEPSSPEADAWEDSLRWNHPLSPEAKLWNARAEASRTPLPPPQPKPTPASTDDDGFPPLAAPVPVPSASSAPAPSAPAATPAARGGHSLQLGAFAQRENADRLRNELAAKKIAARVEPFRAGDRTLFRVLAGNYADAETAAREGKRLLAPHKIAYRVVDLQ